MFVLLKAAHSFFQNKGNNSVKALDILKYVDENYIKEITIVTSEKTHTESTHTHSFDIIVEEIVPTCQNDGKEVRKCSVEGCNETDSTLFEIVECTYKNGYCIWCEDEDPDYDFTNTNTNTIGNTVNNNVGNNTVVDHVCNNKKEIKRTYSTCIKKGVVILYEYYKKYLDNEIVFMVASNEEKKAAEDNLLFIKKFFIRFFGFLRASTTIVSNTGKIDIDDKFKKYVDNILLLVMPNKIQKIKCSICSYEEKLNVTMNSVINDLHFEKTFYSILSEKFDTIDLISNNDKRSKYVSDKNK